MKNAFVFQQKNQIRAPRQGNGQFAVQDLTHGNAAGKLIQEAWVVSLEQFLYHQVGTKTEKAQEHSALAGLFFFRLELRLLRFAVRLSAFALAFA
jgi:hypothetical protein